MEDVNLYNAVIIGENPDGVFIIEGDRLHAVDILVKDLHKEKGDPKRVVPLMRKALEALRKYSKGKVPHNFIEMISLHPDENDQLIEKICSIYSHLPHHERNRLSSLIHHKQSL